VRAAFISDVHANLVAFLAVMERIEHLGIESIFNAGDIVGYYPLPNEIIHQFREHDIVTIKGNHDQAVLDAETGPMNSIAVSVVNWTAKKIGPEERRYLGGLEDRMDVNIGPFRSSIFHGSPRCPDEYIYEDDATEELLDCCGSRLLVLGHTHVPFVKYTDKGVIMNPGSVGQPRDGDPRACFMTYDSTKDHFELHRVDYDMSIVVKEMEKQGLPRYLADRLWIGR
jgi:predicted phosphodiesterase